MKRPSFQFYPADWSGNTNLRRCSHQEKGVWIDVMCLMHDSNEYGILRWPLGEIAKAIGCSSAMLRKLVVRNVLKGVDSGQCDPFIYVPRSGGVNGDPVALIQGQPGPIWYSSRMVRDEYVRQHRGESSRFSKQPRADEPLPTGLPMPPFGDGSTSSSISTSISMSKEAHARAPISVGRECVRDSREKAGVDSHCADALAIVQSALLRMRSAGIQDDDPLSQKLIELAVTSSDPDEFYYAAEKSVGLGKGFAYALGVVEGWRRDAAAYFKQSSSGAPNAT